MNGPAKLLNPVMKLVFEKLANDTEKQMTTILNRTVSEGEEMIGTILSALVVGLIVGALARLIMPGKQTIGVIMTIVLGAIGSFVGTWLTYQLGYSNSNGGWEVIPFLVGIIVAIVLIAIYVGITGRQEHAGSLAAGRGQPVYGTGVVVGDVHRAVRTRHRRHRAPPPRAVLPPETRRRASACYRDARPAKERTPPPARCGGSRFHDPCTPTNAPLAYGAGSSPEVKLMPSGAA